MTAILKSTLQAAMVSGGLEDGEVNEVEVVVQYVLQSHGYVSVTDDDTKVKRLLDAFTEGDGIIIEETGDVDNKTLTIAHDGTLKVSDDDTTAEHLQGKIGAGNGISINVTSPGGNETLVITASGGNTAVSNDDTTPGYLQSKLSAGNLIAFDVLNDGANEQLRIAYNGSDPADASTGESPILDGNFWRSDNEYSGLISNAANGQYITPVWQIRKINTTAEVPVQGGDGAGLLIGGLFSATDATVSASDLVTLYQRFPVRRMTPYLYKDFGIVFRARATFTGKLYCCIGYKSPLGSGTYFDMSFIASFNINAINTWEDKYIAVPANVLGYANIEDVERNNDFGDPAMVGYFEFNIVLRAGTNYHGTDGAWTNTDDVFAASDIDNIFVSINQTITLADVHIKFGGAAGDPYPRSQVHDRKEIQRYIFDPVSLENAYGFGGGATADKRVYCEMYAATTDYAYGVIYIPHGMVNPTIEYLGAYTADDLRILKLDTGGFQEVTDLDVMALAEGRIYIRVTATSTFTVGPCLLVSEIDDVRIFVISSRY